MPERTPEANNFVGNIEPAIWRTNKLTAAVDFKNNSAENPLMVYQFIYALLNQAILLPNGFKMSKRMYTLYSLSQSRTRNRILNWYRA